MYNMKSIYFILFSMVFVIESHAVGTPSSFSGTIKQVVCHAKEVSSVCQVAVNGTPSANPCSAPGGWVYTFNGVELEGKNLLSILLAAQISKSTVTIAGQGSCNLAASSEDLRHVYIHTN